MNEPLTDRQTEVLQTIRQMTEENGYPPTIRELGPALGISSPNGVVINLKALERKGYIKRTAAKSRGIVLVDNNPVRDERERIKALINRLSFLTFLDRARICEAIDGVSNQAASEREAEAHTGGNEQA